METNTLTTPPKEHNLPQLEKGNKTPILTPTTSEVIIVSWDDPSDPANPLNWSQTRKWLTAILTSFGGLITLMSGSMLAPALSVIGRDLDVSEAGASMSLSIFILAFGFGPLVLAPMSETFGRRPVWIFGCLWYTVWNTVCGFANSRELLIAGRLLAGLGASAEFAVSRPIVNDCWSADERGKSFAISGTLPLLGPALGPILGGVMVQTLNWRWLFFVLSIFDVAVLGLFIVFLPETHAPTILAKKAAALRKSTGEQYHTEERLASPSVAQRLKLGLSRPFWLLVTQPVIQITSLVLAYQFGLLYIALSTFSTLWTDRYHQTPAMSGVHYLAIIIGYMVALQGGGWATDVVWARLKEKNGGKTRPENRLPLMLPGAVLIPIGLLWYGWAAQQHSHWILPDIGIAIFGCGFISSGQAAQAYIVDAFLDCNASAGAATQLLRNIFAFAFPIFAPSLYTTFDYGYGNTLLAGLAIVIGIPAPCILWRYGEALREKAKPAK
ncbi:major facilitator superfamily transporter [Massariosphaeria phaeospora]|uniref:Major facilitator superfamily transporter n=1 Tax=Massariosphaeria phaeospora TaxID=100035 RepID=A0A7C8I1H3_9PLEO|nr:major facilitator superfamily transporter [Massariosphaeria phaeospora]